MKKFSQSKHTRVSKKGKVFSAGKGEARFGALLGGFQAAKVSKVSNTLGGFDAAMKKVRAREAKKTRLFAVLNVHPAAQPHMPSVHASKISAMVRAEYMNKIRSMEEKFAVKPIRAMFMRGRK